MPEVQRAAAGARVGPVAGRALYNTGGEAERRVGDDDRVSLQHGGEVEGDGGRGGIYVDLQDGQHEADGCHRQQQLEQHPLLVPPCAGQPVQSACCYKG